MVMPFGPPRSRHAAQRARQEHHRHGHHSIPIDTSTPLDTRLEISALWIAKGFLTVVMQARRNSSTAMIVLAIAGLAVVAAVAAGGLRASRTQEIAEAAFDPAQMTDVPIIAAKHESGGFKLLGIEFDAPDRWLSIAVKPPPGCLRADGGEEVVIGGDGCDAVEVVAGPVQGGGVTAQGERWVELRIEVDRECHRAAAVGDPWPAPAESCR
jgi:hypothetical protein